MEIQINVIAEYLKMLLDVIFSEFTFRMGLNLTGAVAHVCTCSYNYIHIYKHIHSHIHTHGLRRRPTPTHTFRHTFLFLRNLVKLFIVYHVEVILNLLGLTIHSDISEKRPF